VEAEDELLARGPRSGDFVDYGPVVGEAQYFQMAAIELGQQLRPKPAAAA
jgi:hypothetical protein